MRERVFEIDRNDDAAGCRCREVLELCPKRDLRRTRDVDPGEGTNFDVAASGKRAVEELRNLCSFHSIKCNLFCRKCQAG